MVCDLAAFISAFVGTEKLEIIREAEKKLLRRQDTHGGINQSE